VGFFLFCTVCAGAQEKKQGCDATNLPQHPHNVILFITDGLRHDVVTDETAPTILRLRREGVDFTNSHSLFPTVTTANASAFATGYQLGDTGDFANALYTKDAVPIDDAGTLSWTPFLEDNVVLASLNWLHEGNYLGKKTLMELAREHCYNTAAIGKVGPTAIQDVSEIRLENRDATRTPKQSIDAIPSLVIDDSTGKYGGVPVPAAFVDLMNKAGLSLVAPNRANGQAEDKPQNNGYNQGTLAANVTQQLYFANLTTQVILPVFARAFRERNLPFLLVFWSRDPDGTQHNQGDSLYQLHPGINGITSHAAIRNADNNLAQIIEYLKTNGLFESTDIVVVADHGFSTISKGSRCPKRDASSQEYPDLPAECLAPGFLAIDLAKGLSLPLYDPDTAESPAQYKRVLDHHYPKKGNGLIGGLGQRPTKTTDRTDAEVIVTASGGSSLIYLPAFSENEKDAKRLAASRSRAQDICKILLENKKGYVDGVFVNDLLGEIPGTLSFSQIGLMGTAKLPRPAIIVNFRNFALDPQTPETSHLSGVEISDTDLRQGQGNHGGLNRADTYNNMVARGPDFRHAFVDDKPVSNADIAATLACRLHWATKEVDYCKDEPGSLRGRVLEEALDGASDRPPYVLDQKPAVSKEGQGRKTIFLYQLYLGHRYYDAACLRRKDASQLSFGRCTGIRGRQCRWPLLNTQPSL
jgi:hypothetical protein